MHEEQQMQKIAKKDEKQKQKKRKNKKQKKDEEMDFLNDLIGEVESENMRLGTQLKDYLSDLKSNNEISKEFW